MSDRAQLRHALIDVSFFTNAKIIELGEEYGELAQLFAIKIILLMSGATNANVTRLACRGLRGSLTKEKAEAVLDFCIKRGIFHVTTDDCLSNSRVEKDQESLATKRKAARDRQDKKRGVTRDNGVTEMSEARDPDPATVTDPDHNPNYPKKEAYAVNLPCIKLTHEEFAGFVMNHHHGNEAAAREMCQAASDNLQAKGEPVAADSMAYLRGWMRKGLQFERGAAVRVPKSILETRSKIEALDRQ